MDAAGDARIFPTQQQQVQVPTLLFPPSPLTPSSSSPASASASASHSHHHASASLAITSLPILVLTVLGILTTSALLLTYYVFVIRCCLTWHASDNSSSAAPASLIISLSRRRRRRRTAAASSDELPVVYGGAPAEARGLDAPAIQALPAFRYRTKAVMFKNDAAAAECAVCLGEFQEEERVRLLPSCLHIFHVDCIDTWLHGNANCPLCRAAAITTSTTHLPLSMDHQLQRQEEEVIIQVQVAGAEEEEDITPAAGPQGDAADQHVSSKGSPSEAAPPHCR